MTNPDFVPQEVIRRKRDRLPLAPEDIARFVRGTTDGSVSPSQIGAFTMAVYLNGMTAEERLAYTLAMRDSGRVIDWSEIGLSGPTIIDKHSSGGVGDEKISLILVPLVAACGIHMPMISARGLGHTGGEIDLLDAIAGYDTAPTTELFMRTVAEVGGAIIGPTADLAPADRPIYFTRDVSATVESVPLITGSIMSKKLAAGINGLVMTVPFGSGAFMADIGRARELAESLVGVAAGVGIPMVALISDLTVILGSAVGSNPQLREIVAFLTGTAREPRVLETVLALAAETLVMGGLADDIAAGRRLAEARLDDGSAAERFARMIAAFGGPTDFVDHPERYLEDAPVVRPVFADDSGYLSTMDCYAIGMALLRLGSGRTRPEDSIDHAVGLSEMAQRGEAISRDRPICVLHARSDDAWNSAAAAIRAAISLAHDPVGSAPVIVDRLAVARPQS
ncbi:thymidine phosphorylase [Pleomorphomonas sp. PLEO]|uniref:thymidine phosphorylase n=1 Tax=Pleomorphomonas sp. PLEO TaxID=3239306 RepID=UPI00351E67A4